MALGAVGRLAFAVPREIERYPFALGGTAMVLFAVQVVTGLLLASRYVPTPTGAPESVGVITQAVAFGWFVRGVHRAAASLMVAAVLLHFARALLGGAGAPPRQVTWLTGVGLLVLTLAFGFSGYALVGDADAVAATAVGLQLMGPLRALCGAPREVIGRLYVLHVAALPVLALAAGLAHVVLVRRHSPAEGEPDTIPHWPDHTLFQAFVGAGAVTIAVAIALLAPPAPVVTDAVAVASPRPEWYFLPPYALLKLVPRVAAAPLLVVACVLLCAWPWLEARLARGPRLKIAAVALRAVLLLGPLALALWEALT
ncbi:MAG: cytochrome bc complex cytochrome b subunit [Deltaproteobacteria bacterium]|nr:cytochrome bc complex cytochrome b subunit [Deltaproteobacteria bacterium]